MMTRLPYSQKKKQQQQQLKFLNKSVFFSGYPSFVHRLTESDIHSCHLPDDIGTRWKDLARGLGYKEAFITSIESEKDSNKECCITLLVKWMEKEGEQGATCEKLATALTNIGLQNLADRLIGMWLRLCIKPEENTFKKKTLRREYGITTIS